MPSWWVAQVAMHNSASHLRCIAVAPAAHCSVGTQPMLTYRTHASRRCCLQDTFWGSLAAPRVLDSFKRLQTGEELIKEWPGEIQGPPRRGWVGGWVGCRWFFCLMPACLL